MFESVLVRRPIFGDKRLDAGLLAETLLFYQNSYLVLDHGSIISLVNEIGGENLRRLIEDGHMRASFMKQGLGTHTTTQGPISSHKFISIQQVNDRTRKVLSKMEGIKKAIFRASGETWATRKLAKRLDQLIPQERLTSKDRTPINLIAMADEDLRDSDYTSAAIRLVLQELVPNLQVPDDWQFRTQEAGGRFRVDTNFDFEAINAEYHQHISPKHSSITPGFLLNHILDARSDIAFASKHMAELITTPMASKALELKFSTILEKRGQNANDIQLFTHDHLDGKAIREAINSGERTFAEFISLLENAHKFKEWLKGAHSEIGLAKEYYDSVTAKSWVDKLPGKSFRFSFFTGAGILTEGLLPGVGSLAGIGLGLADTFLVDKLIQGWRPSQFVEEKLSEFVNP